MFENNNNNNKCIVGFTFKKQNIYLTLYNIIVRNIRPNSFIVQTKLNNNYSY